MSTANVLSLISSAKSKVFRKLWLKRRLATTGLFETSWQEVSKHVLKWGSVKNGVDYVRQSKFTSNEMIISMSNESGFFNDETYESSFWYGYANQQRTLVKIDAGFVHQTQSSSGIWTNTELPTLPTLFIGFIQGDIMASDKNTIGLPAKPLTQVFRDFPCRNVLGWTSTGVTASQFFTMIWNMTDGAGQPIFRPFFQDTLTYWQVTTTSAVYTQLNTSTADEVNDKSVWDIFEKLAEAEDFLLYVSPIGALTFRNRNSNTTTAQFQYYGGNYLNNTYGKTIKKIDSYGKKTSNYYSRVEVKWQDTSASSAIRSTQASYLVSGSNTAWNLGFKTLKIENLWIATATAADTIANNVFQNVSVLKNEITFTTQFTPMTNVLDRVSVSYDTGKQAQDSLWDLKNWEGSTLSSDDLIWYKSGSDVIFFDAANFKILNIDINLDNLECKFVGIEI